MNPQEIKNIIKPILPDLKYFKSLPDKIEYIFENITHEFTYPETFVLIDLIK